MKIQLVLILSLMSLLFATALEKPVHLLERRFVPRPLAILAVYLMIIGGIALPAVLIAPEIGNQAENFRAEAPAQLEELRASWRTSRNPLLNGPGEQLLARGIALIENPSTDASVPRETAFNLLAGIGGLIFGILAVLVIAFYYLMEKTLLRQLVLLEIPAAGRERVNRVWDNVERKVGDWLRGQLTLCLIIGVTATLGYGILDVRFWPLLGLWAGITEIIPIVGPWLGGVPAVVIALTMSWNKAVLVIGFIVLLQLLENTILVPRVMRGAVGLTPLTVFVAILAGTEFMGFAGALLAIPVSAALQVILTDYLDARRAANREVAMPATSNPAWRWMRGPLTTAPRSTPVDVAERGHHGHPPTGNSSPTQPAVPGWTGDLIARAAGAVSHPTPDAAEPSPSPPITPAGTSSPSEPTGSPGASVRL